MRQLRAGILGLGVGEQHIAGYERHTACKVVAVCDFSPEKREMAQRKYPHLRVLANAEELLDDPTIDVVTIATFDTFHAAQVLRAFERGKHVFVEKPLCLHDDELAAIRTALRDRPELRLSSNLILRKCPRFQLLHQMIRAGDFGRLYYLEGDYNYGRLHKITHGWRGQIPFYSIVHGGAIHLIDLLLWLIGEPIVEVTARGNQLVSQDSPFQNHDLVVALVRFAGGALAKIAANFGCVHPHYHVLNLYGTEATFLNGTPDGRLFRSRDPAQVPEPITAAYPGAHKGDLVYSFIESIIRGTPAEVTAEDVCATMAVSLAIERACHQDGPVTVPEAAV